MSKFLSVLKIFQCCLTRVKMPLQKKFCAFPYCLNSGFQGFFTIPKDSRRQKWLEVCKISESEVRASTLICHKHFKPDEFHPCQNMRLKSWAIPHFYNVSLLLRFCIKSAD